LFGFVDSGCAPCYTRLDLKALFPEVVCLNVISVGFGNYVTCERIVAIISPDSSPIKRAVQEARKVGNLIDATQGRKTKSVVFTDDGRLVISGLGPETLAKRMNSEVAGADLE